MDDNDLRKIILNNLSSIRKLMITEHAASIIRFSKEKVEISSSELSEKLNISIQNASAQLNNLYLKGYLFRMEVVSETGGYEFVYRSTI